ncbi:MAG: APC family permease, partial [Eggerthellaceae bacterium]|nr:APC family permease [Eggerthellaceae bacterium]
MAAPEYTGASGAPQLRHALSPLSAWSLSLGCIVGWGAFVMPATTFLPIAGPVGTAIAFAVGALVMVVIALDCGFMTKRYPGAGGIYEYVRETFGPNHAFVCSWCLVLVYGAAISANATAFALLARSVVGDSLRVGFHYVIAGYDVFFGEVATALVIVVAVVAVCYASVRASGILQTVLVCGLVAGTLAIVGLAVAGPAPPAATFEPVFGEVNSPVVGTLGVLAVAPWAFVGFESVCQETSEGAFPASRMTAIMVTAVLCGAFVYAAIAVVTAMVVPDGFANWAEYVKASPDLEGLLALPSFYAAYAVGGEVGFAIAVVVALCAVLSGVVGFFLASSRLLYAMSRDGVLPSYFSRVDPKRRTPVRALVFVAAMAFIGSLFGRTVLGWFVDLLSLGVLVAYGYTAAAVIYCARRDRSPAWLALGVLGVVLTTLFLVLFLFPGLGAPTSEESYIILIAWIALGVNFYKP